VFLADRIIVLQPHPGRVAHVVNVEMGPQRDRSTPDFLRLRDHVLEALGVRKSARETSPIY
jgi:ABC-type nitrate/sulfonate/bicarbonate transport system ATPase subunit